MHHSSFVFMRHCVWTQNSSLAWCCPTRMRSIALVHGCRCLSLRHCTTAGHARMCSSGGTDGTNCSSNNTTETNSSTVPSIIFFGGDILSLVALQALHGRFQNIEAAAASSPSPSSSLSACSSPDWSTSTSSSRVKSQLVVVCPFLPGDPVTISQRHKRQYPVARYCVQHGIPLLPVDHPTSLARSTTLQHLLHPWRSGERCDSEASLGFDDYIASQPLEAFDVAVVVSFRYFLPNSLLERLPRVINLHPSLLPRYRGASPIFAPLLRGDSEGGASVIKLPPRQRLMDSGDVLWQQSFPIPCEMSIREYFPLVAKLGTAGLCECIFGGPPALKPNVDSKQMNDALDTVADLSHGTECDWPQTFNARWASAWSQGYNVHFTEDPYHAPRLSKGRAVIHWHTMTAEEAHGTWRAFVGGAYYSPTLNATLDKGATPVRDQLLKRLLVRETRQTDKRLSRHSSDNHGEWYEDGKLRTSAPHARDVGCVNAMGEMGPATRDSHLHLRQRLLVGCTFTDAIHPKKVPSAVIRELQLLDEGESGGIQTSGMTHHQNRNNGDDSQHLETHIKPGSGYFPKAVEAMCAVKCRDGWFVWQAAALQGSTPQSADLLRKGMAMKIGVVYPHLFVDSNGRQGDAAADGNSVPFGVVGEEEMGIKGRRKRLRERESKAAADASAHGEEWDDDDDQELALMGDGPMRPPVDASGRLRMKKTDFFNMQDMDYLDRIAEEHANRRTSHLRMKTHDEMAHNAEAEEETEELLQHHFDTEDALRDLQDQQRHTSSGNLAADEKGSLHERRRRAGTSARFDHPLIGIEPHVVHALQEEGFRRMTPIQERVIPYAMQGYDLLGQAKTGSGKTLAFCVPVLHSVINFVGKRPNGTYSLMLAPTKELCVQTHNVLKSICEHIPNHVASFSVQLITGGTKVVEERRLLTAGPSIVVGTPGRIHDHVQHCTSWDLARIRFLVLDEADRMLADGFQRDLDAIVDRLPHSRQTFLFSATNSKSVRDLARLSLARTTLFISTTGSSPTPIQLQNWSEGNTIDVSPLVLPPYISYEDPCGDNEQQQSALTHVESSSTHHALVDDAEPIPSSLRQFCHITPVEKRMICLYTFVKRISRTSSKAMVFCSTIASTTYHFQMMGSVGFHDEVMMLHGHMKHRQRVATFQAFNEWKTGVLFCTDVAARGLDIPDVEWILQYDPPLDPTEYVHRIGRTARAGNVGNALLFLTPEEVNFVRYLAKFGITLEKYPMPNKLPLIQMKLEHVLQLDPIVAKSAVSAYKAHIAAYQSHLLKETFNIRRLDLDGLARSFALTSAPTVSLPKNTAEEKRREYVKGKLKSLNRQRHEAKRYYEAQKTKQQWSSDGRFVGVAPPNL